MKAERFSIDPDRDQLRCSTGPAPACVQLRDYVLNPDRFFAGIFAGDAPVLLPLLMLVLSVMIPVVLVGILLRYVNTFVPYPDLPHTGLEVYLAISVLVVWIGVIIYFLLFSGEPARPSAGSHSWATRGTRIFSALGLAIIPMIVLGLIGTTALVLILPGVAIVSPPTTAYVAYQKANADYQHSLDQVFASMGSGGTMDGSRLEENRHYQQDMSSAKAAAENEATAGLQQLSTQLMQNPTLDRLGSIMQILSLCAMLWGGVLLAYGIRHALDISLARSAILVVILIVLNLIMQFMN